MHACMASSNTFVFFTTLLLLLLPATSDVAADVFLRFKEQLRNTSALRSWGRGGRPCPGGSGRSWAGVVCLGSSVLGLHLEGMGLTAGAIDVEPLASLPDLSAINFAGNHLAGPIPEVSRLRGIKIVNLTGNKFSGEIPYQAFAGMASLEKLDLSSNQFSGPVPASLGVAAPNLKELHLENNRFTGGLPEFHQLELKAANFSNNRLEGPIPLAFLKFNISSFKGNRALCGRPLPNPCETHGQKFFTAWEIMDVLMVIAILLGIIGIAIAVIRFQQDAFRGKRTVAGDNESKLERGSSHYLRVYHAKEKKPTKYSNLERLTFVGRGRESDFELQDLLSSFAQVLGAGRLGSAYKVSLANGPVVVVKRFKEMSGVGQEVFEEQMRRLGRMSSHPNVLPLLAYHDKKEEKMLVTDYVKNGSLKQALHGNQSNVLDWPTRLKIVKGVARGLSYIHRELASMNLPHGHLKSSNILLEKDMDPILTDYGLVLLMNSPAKQTMVAYNSPEYKKYSQVSKKSDVWCLGMLILEVLTGKAGGGMDMVALVTSMVREEWTGEVFDKKLLGDRSNEGDMFQLLQIGLKCCEEDVERRWDLKQALDKIEELKEKDYYEDDAPSDTQESSSHNSASIVEELPLSTTKI